MDLKENADIRRALDNLQHTVEVLNDRYRDARRERKQLRDRIEELMREREVAEANAAAQTELAAGERHRAAQFEERALQAEKAGEELLETLAQYEHTMGESAARVADLDQARAEIATLRAAMEREQRERGALEEKHLQAIGKLDAATRAEAMARTDVAALEAEKQAAGRELADARAEIAHLERRVGAAGEGAGAGAAAELLAVEKEAREAHARLEQREREHATSLAKMEERLAAADLERERFERRLRELEAERDSARSAADALREQIRMLDVSDDDRLKAQSARIEELTHELDGALRKAARREDELADAATQMAALENRVAALAAEVEHLKSVQPDAGRSGLADDERRQITEQIDTAIGLIDQHLAASE